MGGARCSYRTCTIKSDKKTHMFHFPVFDKVRCHRWITNAQKLNFLDLKLSQLKNRVICEHHFTDECFMNVMKGKLKNTAVPTEDGPFCVKLTTENDDTEIAINLDDIETDYLTNMEKKAHFSVKYGDFLTNDVTEPITTMRTNLKNTKAGIPNYKTTSISLQDKGLIFNRRNRQFNFDISQDTPCNSANNHSNANKDTKIAITDPVSSLYHSKPLPDPKVVAIKFEDLNLTEQGNKSDEALGHPVLLGQNYGQSFIYPSHKVVESSVISIPNQQQFDQPATLPSAKVRPNKTPIPLSKKVKIISEEKIIEPVKLKGELQTVSPLLLLMPDRKKMPNVQINGTEVETFYFNVSNTGQVEDLQGINSSIISSQPAVTNQMYNLHELNNSTSLVNQFEDTNNVQVQNELLTDNKPADVNYINMEFKQEPELLTAIENVSTFPNVECVSMPANEPSIFTVSDAPQDTRLLTGSTYVVPIDNKTPTDVENASILSTDAETPSVLAANPKHSSGVLRKSQIVSGVCQNKQDIVLNKRPLTLLHSPNKTILKSRLPPEKLAAIEEKRKFNMKLRDIINSCLNNLDDEPEKRKLSAVMKKKLGDKKVAQHISEESTLPTSQENNIAYLETRLQRMEDILLNKIEQNSIRISDLKRTLKPSSSKKFAYTQTYFNAETTKKHLYQQISQFLSPEANSKIYEELFINSCVDKSLNEQSHKKRKRR